MATLAMAACTSPARDQIEFSEERALSAPTTVGAAPMFAVSRTGTEAAAWVSAPEGGTDGRLYVAVNGGQPAEIRDTLGPIEAHGESPPKLAFAPDGRLYAIYVVAKVVEGARFPLAALRFVRSADEGKTWSKPVTVTNDAEFGSHNFHALHAAPDGAIYVSWLGAPPKHTAAGAADGAASHAAHGQSTAWITRSTDGGETWSARTRVDVGEACPCCRTGVASGPDGSLYMAWRHVFPADSADGTVRDVVVARSSDKGATWSDPVRVHADDWVFDGCPHAGPSLQVDGKGRVHVAWWTGKDRAAGVWYARSDDGAKSFGAPIPLGVADFSRPAHVQLALASDSVIAAVWDDGTKQVPQVVFRLSRDGGASFGEPQELSEAGRVAGFPVLALSQGTTPTVTVAWTEKSQATAAREQATMPDMKDPTAKMGLKPVGEAEVIVRRAVLQ